MYTPFEFTPFLSFYEAVPSISIVKHKSNFSHFVLDEQPGSQSIQSSSFIGTFLPSQVFHSTPFGAIAEMKYDTSSVVSDGVTEYMLPGWIFLAINTIASHFSSYLCVPFHNPSF